MKITADTNVLLRAALGDNPAQSRTARALLRDAESVSVSSSTLCEFVWVLQRGERRSRSEIANFIQGLLDTENVRLDRQATETGLLLMRAGGDFADGVMAHEGRALGGETFATFDREASELLQDAGWETTLLPAR